jgi:DNA-binding beta-propeller fold protein YncE
MVVSGATAGDGPPFEIGAVAWDEDGGQVLLVAQTVNELHAVDPLTGDRELVSGDTRGTGPAFMNLRGVAVDTARRVAYVADVGQNGIVAVDLATGDRTLVTGAGAGSGPAMNNAQSIALSSDLASCYALDWDSDQAFRVDLATGARAVVATKGLSRRTPWGLAVWDAGDRLLVTRY